MKKIFAAMSIVLLATPALAQSGISSPYSMYGLGALSEQGNSFNRGMNGVGVALRPHNQVNYLTPASYSSIDSLSFIFDAGLSLQTTNFKEGNASKNAKNASFEYVVGGFRAARNFGVSFGLVPITNVGYSFSSSGTISDDESAIKTSYVNSYNGTGGIREVYLGMGWSPIKGLSVGVNGGYLWGELERSVSSSYYTNGSLDNSISTLSKNRYSSISSYKLDFGLQYALQLNDKDVVTIGATYGLGHNLGSDPSLSVINSTANTSVADTTVFVAHNGYDLPGQISAGVSYVHGQKWTVALDYTLQQWGNSKSPIENSYAGNTSYAGATGAFMDRHKVNAGFEYCQNAEGRSFLSRIRYRFGASYATPYLKIKGLDGPSEISVSGGVGIPIVNGYNNRSILSIGAQWVRSDASSLVTENTFRINIGFTFNERWFAKWKFE